MNSKRLYFALVSLLVISGSGGIAAVIYGNKALYKRTENLIALKAESAALEEQQRSLVQAKKDIQTYSELEKIVKTIVPQQKDQARTVREIVKLASETGVSLGNITFPSSTLGQAAPKTTAPAATDATAAPAAPATSPTTQVKPVEGIAGLYQMDVGVQSAGPVSYNRFLNFLKRLEQNRSTSQVRDINVQPVTNSSNVTFNLTVVIYIKP